MLDILSQSRSAVQHVRIAEIKVASQGYLKTTVGSCVAIVLIDHKTGICGLAHCLLPLAPPDQTVDDARFVDRAVANLMRAVGTEGGSKRGVSVYIGGGARMMNTMDLPRASIGDLNIAAAKTALEAHDIRFTVLAEGGNQACTVLVNCELLEVTCTYVNRLLTQ